jgi:hypothetical protein
MCIASVFPPQDRIHSPKFDLAALLFHSFQFTSNQYSSGRFE